MSDGTWRRTGGRFGGRQKRTTTPGASMSRTEAMRMLGSVVYAARLADGTIKIGHTERFDLRLHWLKNHDHQDVELMAFRVGTYEEEQAIHASLTDHRDHAIEYYRPTPEVLAVGNAMRADLGLDAIAA